MNRPISRTAFSVAPRARWMLVALLAAALASPPAFAERGRGHGHGHGHGHRHGGVSFGLFVAAPLITYSLFRPYYAPTYYTPREYYAPVVVRQPPVYIEQPAPQPQAAPQPPQSWWYYCAESQTYYPYVRECPAGWQRVSPQPPA